MTVQALVMLPRVNEPTVPLSDQLRAAVVASGRSRYSLSKETGIDQAVLSKFMAGKSGLSVASIDALAHALGLNLTDRLTKFSRPQKRKGT